MKKLYRPTNERKLCGVASGIAKYLGVDPTLIRVLFAIFGVVGCGVLVYIVCALVIPDEKNIYFEQN